MILSISAKCSDCCHATLSAANNGTVVAEKDGYVPSLMPGGGGDYIELDIDTATGQILNWVIPTQEEIDGFIEDNK